MHSFWVDVGGTFTDCVMRAPDGRLRRHKLLSSGATKGSVAAGSTREQILDAARTNDPRDFWAGCELRLLDAGGQVAATRQVASFERDGGALTLDRPLDDVPASGQAYELRTGLEAPLVGIRWMLGLAPSDSLPPVAVRLGTTRGTNALLTRRGARTAFVTTRGFGDILHIGYQNRPRIFDLDIRKPTPLFSAVVELDERVTPDGAVLRPLDELDARRRLAALRESGVTSLAICLLNAYCQSAHEQRVAAIAAELGFQEISVSHQVAPLIKLVSRGDTTVADAYLTPVLREYVERIETGLRGGLQSPSDERQGENLRLMTSAGGLAGPASFRGRDSILSGPAGGVVGFSRVATAAGFTRAIGFDMGGTSTDVSRYEGRLELEYETEKAGVRIVAPMLSIETVAAGGGSICRFDGVKLVVGPDSAGADPGPACYGRGGPLCVTDVNLWLGRILPEHFPFPLDRGAVERALRREADALESATGQRLSLVELADGFVRVANANMTKAIRSISIAKGCDPRDYVLVGFGGAAPQHACAVADDLGMTCVLNHPDAGVLSAYGIGLADVIRHRAAGVYRPLNDELLGELEPRIATLTNEARAAVRDDGVDDSQIATSTSFDLRYRGLDAFITIAESVLNSDDALPDASRGLAARLAEAYEAEHRRLYGYVQTNRPIEVVAVRAEAVGRSPDDLPRSSRSASRGSPEVEPQPEKTVTAWFDAQLHATRVYRREALAAGAVIDGPAILAEELSTTIVEPGWQAEAWSGGLIVLTRTHSGANVSEDSASRELDSAADSRGGASDDSVADPILLEIFNNQFAGIAEQMGITLRATSSSVNVKERLDFSCAIFTADGDLVVNAPHIPVHLGAMSETVRAIRADNPQLAPGDVYVTNDPYRGGSHLPDVTVVTPVFDAAGRELRFFTASRAHHAEIGGIRPGSMPPFSCTLAEEGVLIRNFKLVDAGRSRAEELRELLSTAPYPSRSIDDNLADLAAQVAANHQGAVDLQRLIERHGWSRTSAYMRHIQAAAERKMRAALARLPDGRREFRDHLDDGSPIVVAITLEGGRATIDFTGTGPVLAGNLNANRAIVTAAVMYVLRALIDEEIPLNQGVLAPIQLVLPECLLNPRPGDSPATSPAVVGGNVETSQRVVDVLLGAFGLAAASQGTMNNLLFGDGSFGYYETICGGAGGTPRAAGADAVHTHMTNTRLTDPEVMERRFPVRVVEFRIRRGSGGGGRHRGGDGIVRRLEFLRPLDVSLLMQRRGPYAPFGLAGGAPGSLGRNTLHRADGSTEPLPGAAQLTVAAGDELQIETPGGGGWG